MPNSSKQTAQGIVALFNASDDTIDMVQTLLTAVGRDQTLIWCRFADLKKGIVDFGKYMEKHNPEVVIFDLSPPYDQNWDFFKVMRDHNSMWGRGVVLTTTNKNRLDEVLGEDSYVGHPFQGCRSGALQHLLPDQPLLPIGILHDAADVIEHHRVARGGRIGRPLWKLRRIRISRLREGHPCRAHPGGEGVRFRRVSRRRL